MKSARILILGLGFATALAACSSNTAPTTVLTTVQTTAQTTVQTPVQNQPAGPSSQKVLGTIDLQAGDNENMLSAKAVTVVTTGGYPLRQRFSDELHQDYITYKYAVKNNGNTPIRNLTFVALNRPQSALGAPATLWGTPFIDISASNPLYDMRSENNVISMNPSPGMKTAPTGSAKPFMVDPQTADFQMIPAVPGYPNALGYGFLAHGPTTGTGGIYERTNSRTIQPGQVGDVFISYHTTYLFNDYVTKFKLAMLVITDSVDALSQSEEDAYDGSITGGISGFPLSAFQSTLNVRLRHCQFTILNPNYGPFNTYAYGRGDIMGAVPKRTGVLGVYSTNVQYCL
jgi:hypothetical protein